MATATKKKPAPKKAPAKKPAPKSQFVVYGTAGGKQGNVREDGGFAWLVSDPKLYPSAAAVKRAINKANGLAEATGGFADRWVAPARVIKHRGRPAEYVVVK